MAKTLDVARCVRFLRVLRAAWWTGEGGACVSQGKRKERKKKGGKQRVAREGEAVSYARCAVASPSASHAVAAASSAMEGRRGEGKREGEAEKRKEDETKKKTASPQRARAHHCDAVCVPSSSSSSGGDRCGLRSCTYTGRRAGERRAHAQEGGGEGGKPEGGFLRRRASETTDKKSVFLFLPPLPRARAGARREVEERHAGGRGGSARTGSRTEGWQGKVETKRSNGRFASALRNRILYSRSAFALVLSPFSCRF